MHLQCAACTRRNASSEPLADLPPSSPCSVVSGKPGAWKDYVKTTFSEAHPNAPKLDDKLFASDAPQVGTSNEF